jgi:hypothetical protein
MAGNLRRTEAKAFFGKQLTLFSKLKLSQSWHFNRSNHHKSITAALSSIFHFLVYSK